MLKAENNRVRTVGKFCVVYSSNNLSNVSPSMQSRDRAPRCFFANPMAALLIAAASEIRKAASRQMNTTKAFPFRLLFTLSAATLGFTNALAADSGAVLEQSEMQLRVTWPMSAEENGVAVFSLDEKKPLIESLGIAAKGQAANGGDEALNPVTLLTVGSRDSKNPQGWGAFFDNTPKRPYETFLVALGKRRVQTTNHGTRTTMSLAEASGGGFRGDVRFTFYRNSPLIHVETVLTTQEDWRAIIYDAGLESAAPSWESMAWNDTAGKFQSVKLNAERRGRATGCGGAHDCRERERRFARGVSGAAPVFLSAGRGLQFEVRLARAELRRARQRLRLRHSPVGHRRQAFCAVVQRAARHGAAARRFLSAHARRCAAGARCGRALHARRPFQEIARPCHVHEPLSRRALEEISRRAKAAADQRRAARTRSARLREDVQGARRGHRPSRRVSLRGRLAHSRDRPTAQAEGDARRVSPAFGQRVALAARRRAERATRRPLDQLLSEAGELDAESARKANRSSRKSKVTARSITSAVPPTCCGSSKPSAA